MLLRVVHMPRLYGDLPTSPDDARRYCSLLVTLLRESTANCVLHVDAGGVVYDAIDKGIRKWPQMHRKRAQQLLRYLEERNRFVPVELCPVVEPACGRTGCQHALGVASQAKPEAVVSLDTCSHCSVLGAKGIRVIDLDDYQASSFCENRHNCERIELADRQWDRVTFERQVWQPIFRYAKHVKLFDRMLGQHLTSRIEFHEPLDPDTQLVVKQNFRRGLEWVFEQFVTTTSGRASRTFEVTCALDSRLDQSVLIAAAATLRGYAAELSTTYGFPMVLNVKKESASLGMRHARFIFTDQIALMVERGFDLLRGDNRIRDVIITHVTDRGTIEREVRDMEDVP